MQLGCCSNNGTMYLGCCSINRTMFSGCCSNNGSRSGNNIWEWEKTEEETDPGLYLCQSKTP